MLKLTFLTSSNIKKYHAKHLCRYYDVIVDDHKRIHYGKGYDEPRIKEREELLKISIEDALVRWKKYISNSGDRLFFIEDTSVIIHSLGSDDDEVPGVDIKYWMKDHDFESIDKELKEKGNDRRVTVRSDVFLGLTDALKKKHSKPYVHFTSKLDGIITEKEQIFSTNPVYPWLDNKTFNKWFVPDGCAQPVSMLSIQDADMHDFRLGAFNEMLEFLEDEKLVNKKIHNNNSVQYEFPIGPYLYLISGPTCAGKTSLAEYLVNTYGYYHIEASDFMYMKYYQRMGVGNDVSISAFAEAALKEKPSIVVDSILSYLSDHDVGQQVVTGLRTSEEVLSFIQHYDGPYRIKVLIADANIDIRMMRYLKRNRGGRATKDSFYEDSGLQEGMGLRELMGEYTNEVILNEGTLEEYYAKFYESNKQELYPDNTYKNNEINIVKPKALEDAILLALLSNEGAYLTTAEIAKLINKTFRSYNVEKSKNNVSRYFNQGYYPFYEAIKEGGVNKYRLSQTGSMHALWLLKERRTRQGIKNCGYAIR